MQNEDTMKDAFALLQVAALELASELEMHYEKEEFYALGATISNLELIRNFLFENEISIPEVVDNVISTYRQGMN